MTLTEELVRIMDMDNPYNEADKKLTKTWMFVNGSLQYIHSFNYDDEEVVVQDFRGVKSAIKVSLLEVFLPETGLYTTTHPDGVDILLITKEPKKQWHKSFNTSFYLVKGVNKDISMNNVSYYLKYLDPLSRKSLLVLENRDIIFFDKSIGYVNDEKAIICTDSRYKQELKDWSLTCL